LDEDLVALGVSFDKPEFFDKALVELRAGGTAANRARRLLDRLISWASLIASASPRPNNSVPAKR